MTCTSAVIDPVRLSPASPLGQPPSLFDEHLELLRDVQRRADAAIALLDAHAWPGAEVDTLARYLHTAVLRQASDEEVLLYPRGACAPLAELSEDHVRLHQLTRQLEQADVRLCSQPELRALIHLVLTVLERHLASEQAVLASLLDVPSAPPSTASAATSTSSWLPVTGDPVYLKIGPESSEDAVDLCIERLLRLRPQEWALVRSGQVSALNQVCRWLRTFDAEGYGVERLGEDGAGAGLRVTRREPV